MNKFNILGRTFTEGVWSRIKSIATAKPEDRLATMVGDKPPVAAGTVANLTKGAKAAKKIMDEN